MVVYSGEERARMVRDHLMQFDASRRACLLCGSLKVVVGEAADLPHMAVLGPLVPVACERCHHVRFFAWRPIVAEAEQKASEVIT